MPWMISLVLLGSSLTWLSIRCSLKPPPGTVHFSMIDHMYDASQRLSPSEAQMTISIQVSSLHRSLLQALPFPSWASSHLLSPNDYQIWISSDNIAGLQCPFSIVISPTVTTDCWPRSSQVSCMQHLFSSLATSICKIFANTPYSCCQCHLQFGLWG